MPSQSGVLKSLLIIEVIAYEVVLNIETWRVFRMQFIIYFNLKKKIGWSYYKHWIKRWDLHWPQVGKAALIFLLHSAYLIFMQLLSDYIYLLDLWLAVPAVISVCTWTSVYSTCALSRHFLGTKRGRSSTWHLASRLVRWISCPRTRLASIRWGTMSHLSPPLLPAWRWEMMSPLSPPLPPASTRPLEHRSDPR